MIVTSGNHVLCLLREMFGNFTDCYITLHDLCPDPQANFWKPVENIIKKTHESYTNVLPGDEQKTKGVCEDSHVIGRLSTDQNFKSWEFSCLHNAHEM